MCRLSVWGKTASFRISSVLAVAALTLSMAPPRLPADDLFDQADQNGAEESGSAPPRRFEFHVYMSDGKPVKDAKVTPWAVLCQGGSFGVEEKWFPVTKSDAEGNVTLVFPDDERLAEDKEDLSRLLRDGLNRGLKRIAVRVDHPDHPLYSEYVDVAGPRKIDLVDSTTIIVRINQGDDPRTIGPLYPVLSRTFFHASDFSTEAEVLTIRRVDRTSDQAARWLRIVELPRNGPARFSDLIDLNEHPGNPVNLEIKTRVGAQLVGRLAGDVPRPVKNGRVVCQIVAGQNAWDGWSWGATAEINPDGKFTINSLPPDENLQLIALCDGWVSSSPTVEEMTAFGKEHEFDVQNPVVHNGHVQPQLYRLTSGTIVRGIPMQPTSSCEVTVVDDAGQPVVGAEVSFWPNQFWFRGGAQILGQGFSTLSFIRKELATGKRPELDGLRPSQKSYSAKTDDRGVALITNLPAGGDAESNEEREYPFFVSDDRFESTRRTLGAKPETVKIAPGVLGRITVRLAQK